MTQRSQTNQRDVSEKLSVLGILHYRPDAAVWTVDEEKPLGYVQLHRRPRHLWWNMRNIFDQYSQPENQITHALMTALNEDRKLLDGFLKDIARYIPPEKSVPLYITEQSYPGDIVSDGIDEDEVERRGIPDAWITAGEDWCLIIENKVLSAPSNDQLHRHLKTAQRLGFTAPKLLLLTIRPGRNLPKDVEVAPWSSVYKWLQGQTAWSKWAQRLAAYLEVIEARMTDREQMESGTLTAFNGFRFGEDKPFAYLESKRVLGLAMDELRRRTDLPSTIGVDPKLPGRGAIKGAWDFLSFARDADGKKFTAHPHLSLGIGTDAVSAMVTLPDKAGKAWRRLRNLDEEDFKGVVDEVLEKMRPLLLQSPGVEPRLRIYQRHWPKGLSSPSQTDARLDIDLRTHGNKDGDKTKFQPEWIKAVFAILKNKKSNIEMQIGAEFPYRTCKAIREPEALDFVAAAWIACKPYISALGVL